MDIKTLEVLATANQQTQAQAKALTDPARDALIDAIWEAADQDDITQVAIVKATGFTRERLRQLCSMKYRAAELKRRADR